MLKILEDITRGKGKADDISLLLELGEAVKEGSLCGLGQPSPNPVLTTLRYFRNEYEEHIDKHYCSAKACKDLISYHILPDKCTGCGICLTNCHVGAIKGDKRTVHIIDQNKCVKCGVCWTVCPSRFNAIIKVPKKHLKIEKESIPASM